MQLQKEIQRLPSRAAAASPLKSARDDKEGIPPDQRRLAFRGRKIRILAVHHISPTAASSEAATATVTPPIAEVPSTSVKLQTRPLGSADVNHSLLEQMRMSERANRTRRRRYGGDDDDDDSGRNDDDDDDEADGDEKRFVREDDAAFLGDDVIEAMTRPLESDEYADDVDYGGIQFKDARVKGKSQMKRPIKKDERKACSSRHDAQTPIQPESNAGSIAAVKASVDSGVAVTCPSDDDGGESKETKKPTPSTSISERLGLQDRQERNNVKRKRAEACAAIEELASANHSWDVDSVRHGDAFEPSRALDSIKLDMTRVAPPLKPVGELQDVTVYVDTRNLRPEDWTVLDRNGRQYHICVEEEQIVHDRVHDVFDKINSHDGREEVHGPLATNVQHEQRTDRTTCKRTLLKVDGSSKQLFQIVYFSAYHLESDGIVIDGKYTPIPRPASVPS
jgi:hypothetical protein